MVVPNGVEHGVVVFEALDGVHFESVVVAVDLDAAEIPNLLPAVDGDVHEQLDRIAGFCGEHGFMEIHIQLVPNLCNGVGHLVQALVLGDR